MLNKMKGPLRVHVNKKIKIILSCSLLKCDSLCPRVADDESEPEEEGRSGEDAKEPRDSGCFESSENLESGREEPKMEDEASEEAEKHEQQEEKQTEQLDALQEQLQELTVDEGS